MFLFDQLKREDPQLRLLSAIVLAGLLVLLAGLWWVQIVSSREYQANLDTQSFRTVRVPAVRGKLLDRNGITLADNRPVYNVSLYLEDLRPEFQKKFAALRPRKTVTNSPPFWKLWLGKGEVKTQFAPLTLTQRSALTWLAREQVVSNVALQVSTRLQRPSLFNAADFRRHYTNSLALPYPLASNLDAAELARFSEQSASLQGVDLEIQAIRFYPNATLAAHLLGHLKRDTDSREDEEAYFSFRLPDYRGVLGVESGYDPQLRGRAGVKTVLVNNMGFRQTENILRPADPGSNVVLTIDARIQNAAEEALPILGPETRGAAVVMDVETGEVLALASVPTYDPNVFIPKLSAADNRWLTDPLLRPQINRATQMQYQPGSTFKTIVALAALERGLNPNENYRVQVNPVNPNKGAYFIGNQRWDDTAPPGDYDLRRALVRSSNSYFIAHGLRPGVFDRVLELGSHLQLGKKIGLNLSQEAAGHFPESERAGRWTAGNTANICIGQGEMDTTPLQMAVVTCALANGGNVLRPQLVDRVESVVNPEADGRVAYPKREIVDVLGVNRRYLNIVRDDMLAETEDAIEGTGRGARVPGLRICGKTGTAERKENGQLRNTVWFISYAPYEKPKYAVVVAIEDGGSGGTTCAPVAKKIYEAILESGRTPQPALALAARGNPLN